MKILVDTREQAPFSFTGNRHYAGTTLEQASLFIGDYSLPGLTDKVAVERKELGDLIQCLGRERERFERELVRSLGLDAFCVVVEATWQDIAAGAYRSKFKPHSAGQSLAAFMVRYRCPFIFAGTRKGAEYHTWSFLRQYLQGAARRWKEIAKSQDDEIMQGARDYGGSRKNSMPWDKWGDDEGSSPGVETGLEP